MSEQRKPSDVVSTELDNEVVLVNMTSKYYYTLNETGRLIWRGLTAGKSENDIAQELVEHFDIDADTALGDINELVTELKREKLIH